MSAIIQSFWFGGQLSTLHALGLRSFIANGHEFHLYVYEDVSGVPDGVVLKDAAEIAPRESLFAYRRGFGRGSYSAFSNLFRYLLLHERGGWWSDTDVVCLKPFDFGAEYVFATERDTEGCTTTASCVIRAPAGAEVLKYCIEECRRRDLQNVEWGEIGPRLLHDATERFDLAQSRLRPETFNPVDYEQTAKFMAPGFDAGCLSASWAVHLWHQKWVAHDMDPDYAPPDSLYGYLRSRYGMNDSDAAAALRRHAEFLETRVATLRSERNEFEWALDSARSEMDSARAELEGARSSLDEAREALNVARTELRLAREETRVTRVEADAERARADAECARADAERARADAEHARADAEYARAEAERERGDAEHTRAEGFHTELEAFREASTRKQQELEREVATLSYRLERMQRTWSWRVTAPARAVLDRIAPLVQRLSGRPRA